MANRYMGIYVNETIQTQGLTFGALAFVLVLLVGVTSMLFFKGKGSRKRVGAGSTTFKIPIPAIGSTTRLEGTSVSSTPSPDFHPIVAALRAELSGDPFVLKPTQVSETGPRKEEVTVVEKERVVVPLVSPASTVTGTTLEPETGIVAIPATGQVDSPDSVVKKVESEKKPEAEEKTREKAPAN